MRKIFILSSLFLMLGFAARAQNVGIGVASPTEKLDVDGNLQFSGALMPGGSAGTPGQLLQSNGTDNAPTWVDPPQGGGGGPVDLTGKPNYLGRWSAAGDTLVHGLVQDDSVQVIITTAEDSLPTDNLNNFVTIAAPGSGLGTADNQRIGLRSAATDSMAIIATRTGADAAGLGPTVLGTNLGFGQPNEGQLGVIQQNGLDNFILVHGVLGLELSTAPTRFGVDLGGTPLVTNISNSGVYGQHIASENGNGVQGLTFTDSLFHGGVYGGILPNAGAIGFGNTGAGVMGEHFTGGPAVFGVTSILGQTNHPATPTARGYGVYGLNFTSGLGSAGVRGFSPLSPDAAQASTNYAVSGANLNITNFSAGVLGEARFDAPVTDAAIQGQIYGVYGVTASNTDSTYGVFGQSFSAEVHTAGVAGQNDEDEAAGVIGMSERGTGVRGIHFSSDGRSKAGVLGINQDVGQSDPFSGAVFHAPGVEGLAESETGVTAGVRGESKSGDAGSAGVIGLASASAQNGDVYGVYGKIESAGSPLSAGIYGEDETDDGTGSGYAGYFNGTIQAVGDVNGASKNFIIDHPVDPENKYLRHVSIESNEALTLYAGTATTNHAGEAVVALPDYFQALNKNFRYNLTCVNQFAQAIVAKKIDNNQFTIRTDKANVEVSWVIYAERQDRYILNNPVVVEMEKPEEHKGLYLHPRAFEQGPEKAIGGTNPRPAPAPKTNYTPDQLPNGNPPLEHYQRMVEETKEVEESFINKQRPQNFDVIEEDFNASEQLKISEGVNKDFD